MLRSISLATVLALATLTGLACIDDSATEEDLAQDLDDVDGKDDGLGPLKPYGTFVAEPAGAGELLKLALNDDRSYSREILVYCITTPCNPIVETGTFKFTRSN